ncbi:MAG: hypothetical protein AB1489_32910, partial [Acidobacteriota bacterium]
MGLVIAVFDLAELVSDEEIEAWELAEFKETYDQLNKFLLKMGLPEHIEPEEIPDGVIYRGEIVGFPYSCIHYLRRAYIYQKLGLTLTPCSDGASSDPVLTAEYQSPQIDSHLIHFSDSSGFYVPIDFAKPLEADYEDEVLGDAVGSSFGLLRELIEVAPTIGIDLNEGELSDGRAAELADFENEKKHPFETERMVWFTLYEAAR